MAVAEEQAAQGDTRDNKESATLQACGSQHCQGRAFWQVSGHCQACRSSDGRPLQAWA